jgi:hypothetical protein
MSTNVIKMTTKSPSPTTTSLRERKSVSPMMLPMEFIGMGKSTTALIAAVVQNNLRAMHELLRVENPEAMLELQQRFAREYVAVLMQGTIALVDAIKLAAAG